MNCVHLFSKKHQNPQNNQWTMFTYFQESTQIQKVTRKSSKNSKPLQRINLTLKEFNCNCNYL